MMVVHPSKQKYNDAWDWVEFFEESQNTEIGVLLMLKLNLKLYNYVFV
jgi:hypothetical protein